MKMDVKALERAVVRPALPLASTSEPDFTRSPEPSIRAAQSEELVSQTGAGDRPKRTAYLAGILMTCAVVYAAASASATVLWIAAGVVLLLFAAATAVCIYAQNNVPY